MILKKSIIIPPLYLAWLIIFAHSVIPHNHHNESESFCTSQVPIERNNSFKEIHVDYCNTGYQNTSDTHNHCHFNISTTLTKILDSANEFNYTSFFIIPIFEQIQIIPFKNNNLLFKHFYLESLSHRGPPFYC